MPSSVEMDEGWRYTLLLNNTDSELIVEYIDAKYAIVPKGYSIIRWEHVDHTDTALPLLKFSTGDMELSSVFSSHDLYENKRIVSLGDLVNSSSCRMTPRWDPETIGHNDSGRPCHHFWLFADDVLRTMGELEKKVRIWHNQCKHLLKKYQEAVDRVKRVGLEFGTFSEMDLESFFMDSQVPTRVPHRYFSFSLDLVQRFKTNYSLLEGEALLRSCGEISYNQAAFVLTSGPPCLSTFSKFALVIRELAWIVDVLCCIIERKPRSLDGWEWSEQRCRLVFSDFTNRLDATQDDSLEADVRRQNADREALRSSLDLKLIKSPCTSSFKYPPPAAYYGWRLAAPIQGELIQGEFESRSGTSKRIQECKWLGETVALSTMSNISKVSAQAETSFLARVQHPNVVEWMGYAFQDDLRYLDSYREYSLVTEHLECDLQELITKLLTGHDGIIIKDRPPFEFLVAVDIALQIVEAMIHLHRCRVLHRDLKPKHILACPKHSLSTGPQLQYTIKLIDFGSSKSGDQGSHFHTRKSGTPIYMAPEVWESEASYSWSADVYSFGMTCFEIFTGRLPFESGMALTFANIQKTLRGEIIFPRWCREDVRALIVKCCFPDPSERPCFEDVRKALWRMKVCDFLGLGLGRYPRFGFF